MSMYYIELKNNFSFYFRWTIINKMSSPRLVGQLFHRPVNSLALCLKADKVEELEELEELEPLTTGRLREQAEEELVAEVQEVEEQAVQPIINSV